MSAGHETADVRDLGDGFHGWACSCGKSAVCTLRLDAEWGQWLHRVAVSGLATTDELAVAS